jgi:hypothetical protein
MATAGTPNLGLDEVGRSAYTNHADYTLVAYTNARNSLGALTDATDLVQPDVLNGYSPILLDGVWSSTNGDVTYVHPGANPYPRWTATGSWNLPVTGVAIVSGATVLHFMDLSTANFVPVNGSWLQVDLATIV